MTRATYQLLNVKSLVEKLYIDENLEEREDDIKKLCKLFEMRREQRW